MNRYNYSSRFRKRFDSSVENNGLEEERVELQSCMICLAPPSYVACTNLKEGVHVEGQCTFIYGLCDRCLQRDDLADLLDERLSKYLEVSN